MSESTPAVSVVIPTHDRSATLRRTLDALCEQTFALRKVEVIVIVDGSSDSTMEMLSGYTAPFTLRIIEQSRQGPAAARNNGAAEAYGKWLIFIDDDIETIPSFIEAHVCAHQHYPGHVIIGYLPLVFHGNSGFFHHELRIWWENMFHLMRRPGHRYRFNNLLSGNFSVETEIFKQIGGFNTDFWCHEDYELGVRFIKAGIPFAFAHDAIGYHHESTDLGRSLSRKYEEGKADVLMGFCHPEMRLTLPLGRFRTPVLSIRNLFFTLAFRWPAAGNILDALLQNILDLFERKNLRGFWLRILNYRLTYHYWVGVAEELGTEKALADFLKDYLPNVDTGIEEINIDLHAGLEEAEQRLDNERPAGAFIYYGKYLVGHIYSQPGTEQLRGIHLRHVLATDLARPLLKALAIEGLVDIKY